MAPPPRPLRLLVAAGAAILVATLFLAIQSLLENDPKSAARAMVLLGIAAVILLPGFWIFALYHAKGSR